VFFSGSVGTTKPPLFCCRLTEGNVLYG